MNDTTSETLFDGENQDEQFDDFENQENEEDSLPPLASNGSGVNLWLDEDRNGNVFLRIDAPFLDSEAVFFNDDVKPGMNEIVEQWRENRE